jgi:hypothetical protein
MRSVSTMFTAAAASAALIASSTAAVAAAPAPAAPAQTPSAWLMLSALSPTSDVALGGAAAAQPQDVPPPPPEVAGGALAEGTAPIAVIGLWVVLIALALSTSGDSGRPNSPR